MSKDITKDEIFEKYEYSINYINRILQINDYNETEKLYLIGYMTKIALDESIKFSKYKNVELKNLGETVKIDFDENGYIKISEVENV